MTAGKARVLSGADRLSSFDGLRSKTGLLTNPTGITREGTPTADLLWERKCLSALFSPEHGVRGEMQAGEEVAAYRNGKTGCPVYSLYSGGAEEGIAGLELFVCDLASVGARYYTYLYTLTEAMALCKKHGVPVLILDRVNPIGGACEGNLLNPAFASGVGRFRTPVRPGMTIGEMAAYLNASEKIGCDLTVLPLSGWERSMYFDETDLMWVPPSPNMPSPATALVYPGTCLMEGTNVSEGRGTTQPFEMFGAPWLDPARVAGEMKKLCLPGFFLRETYFRPMFSKYAGEACRGLAIHVTDRESFSPFRTGLWLLTVIRRTHPEKFRFLTNNFICHLFGGDEILSPDFAPDAYLAAQRDGIAGFRQKAQPYLLYP